MASKKVTARSTAFREQSEEVSDASSPSDHSSNDSSDSDALDDYGSRKRRKISPVVDDEVEEENEPAAPAVLQPMRIRSRSQKGKETKTEELPLPVTTSISAPIDPQTTFASLGVKPWLVGSLSAMAIKRPTGIQKGCIPEIIKGRDCIGGSRTGSGKTVAFAVPILQQWAEDPFGIFALVLTPTR